MNEDKMKSFELEDAANALYAGGWRAEDKEELMSEYDLTEEEAAQLCKALAKCE